MTTSVVINGYEIQNWRTVSILELCRARKTQERGREPAKVKEIPMSSLNAGVTDEMVRAAHARYMTGKETNSDIALDYNASWAGLVYRFKQLGLVYPRAKELEKEIKLTDEEVYELHRRYMAGESLNEMCATTERGEFKISPRTAANYFGKLGLQYPRQTDEPPHLADLVAEAAAQMDDPAADDPTPAARPAPMVIRVEELETRPRLPYAPPAIVREGSLKPVVAMPEVQTMRVNTLEQLPRLADFLRDLRGIEGIQIAGSISIALSIEAEL